MISIFKIADRRTLSFLKIRGKIEEEIGWQIIRKNRAWNRASAEEGRQ
jgi:hypothetical protein